MKLEYLQQAQTVLSKCGAQIYPDGVSAVPLYKAFLMPMVLQPGGAVTFTKEITGNSPWVLRAIASDQASASLTGVRCQIQLPNGRYLFGGNGIDIGQFAWIGSWKWLQDPELRCEPGSKVQVTLTDTGGISTALAVNLLFEGAYLYFIKGGSTVYPPPLASKLPRYFGNLNENILAPAWMQGEGVDTPPGASDEYFVYSTPDPIDEPLTATWTLVAGVITVSPNPSPFEIQIDPGYTFHARRLLFDVQLSGSAAGIVRGKLRTGGGYLLNDSFIDLAKYLCAAEFPANWKIRGGDSVFIDADLSDFTGTGTVTFQVHLEGFRRSK